MPLPGAHLLLAAVMLLPLLTNKAWVLPTDLNIVITAALCVYVGCWRSVKPTPPDQSMSRKVSADLASTLLLAHLHLASCAKPAAHKFSGWCVMCWPTAAGHPLHFAEL